MTCPYCGRRADGPRDLLPHLRDEHAEAVRITEHNGQVFYEMPCPLCDQRHRQRIRKGGDADFLTRHDAQVRLVALDMLVAHLLAEHDPSVAGLEPADPSPSPVPLPHPVPTASEA